MSEDFLFKAVDTVVSKSMAALEALQHHETDARLRAAGPADGAVDAPINTALLEETQRTLDMAVEALEEIVNSNQMSKENKQDG
jgi:hypothetical protein